jgi:hypothetical protein
MRIVLACCLGQAVVTLVIEFLGAPTWSRLVTGAMVTVVYILWMKNKSLPPQSN